MRTKALLSLVFVAATSAGCYTYADVPVVEVTSAPIVASEPYVIYAGRPHYWYHHHWYYRDGGRWYYYPHEPAELHAYRHHHHYYYYYP